VENYASCTKSAFFSRKKLDFSKYLLANHPLLIQAHHRKSLKRLFRRRMMTQSQVSAHLAEKVGISKKQAKSAVDELTMLVVKELKKRDGSLRLAGLGVFRKRESKARMGRNPATGEQIKIPKRTRLRFTAAKALKDAVLGTR
jgi:DNA-binding protein HU-beta